MNELKSLWEEKTTEHPLGALFRALANVAEPCGLTFDVDASGCLCYEMGVLYQTALPDYRRLENMGTLARKFKELQRHGEELWEDLIVVSEEIWYDVSQISDLEIRRKLRDMVSPKRHAKDVNALAFEEDCMYPSLGEQKMLRDKVY